jgi:DDE superfamily endonuclease
MMDAMDRLSILRRSYYSRSKIAWDYYILVYSLAIEEEEKNKAHDGEATFRQRLDEEGRWRRVRRFPRDALLDPIDDVTPWRKLFESGNDQALICATGFDHDTFSWLEERFTPLFNSNSPYSTDGFIRSIDPLRIRGGRPRKIDANTCLGLTLMWTRTRGSLSVLQCLFGITGSPLDLWLRFGRKLVIAILKEASAELAIKPTLPNDEDLLDFADIIGRKYPSLSDCFCVCDGLKLLLEQVGDYEQQSKFYNGWTHDHYITNLFGFAPDGMIIFAVLDAPGSIHDSVLADWGKIYDKLQAVFARLKLRCIMDSAFCSRTYPFILKSAQDHGITSARTPRELRRLRDATSMRQAAEWGMRALQGSFPRLKDRFRYEENGERREVLECIVLLFNFRCKFVGLNQLRNVFVPEWSRDALHFITNIK